MRNRMIRLGGAATVLMLAGCGATTAPVGEAVLPSVTLPTTTTTTTPTTTSTTPTTTPTAPAPTTPTAPVIPTTPTTPTVPGTSDAMQVETLINDVRQANALAALSHSNLLTIAAAGHAADMVENNFFSHTGSDGSTPFERVTRAGYTACYVAENIGIGQNSPSAIVDAWQGSPGHRANNLSGSAVDIGTAMDVGPTWVTVFAAPC